MSWSEGWWFPSVKINVDGYELYIQFSKYIFNLLNLEKLKLLKFRKSKNTSFLAYFIYLLFALVLMSNSIYLCLWWHGAF